MKRMVLIEGTDFDLKWLENILLTHAQEENAAIGANSTRIGQNQGHLSALARVEISWEWPSRKLPPSVVLKHPTNSKLDEIGGDSDIGISKDFVFDVHNKECDFYALWDSDSAPARIPKCYYHQKAQHNLPGILILEDLTDGGIVPNLLDGLQLEEVLDLTKQMAYIAAWSMLNRGKWAGKFLRPKEGAVESWTPFIKSCMQSVQDLWPNKFPRLNDSFIAGFGEAESINLIYTAPEILGISSILCHGDLWASNVMVRTIDQETSDTNKIKSIFDWQLVHTGVPGEDISRFLRSSVSTEIRRRHFGDVLSLYYETLKAEVAAKDPKMEIPFTFDELCESYDYCAVPGFTMGIVLYALQLLEAQHSENRPNNMEGIAEFTERLNSLIEDYLIVMQKYAS